MKKSIIFLFLAICAVCTISCDALRSVTESKVEAQGAPYELIIVCNSPYWEGELGKQLRNVFSAEIPYLAQEEPEFDVLRVTQQGFDNLVLRHRNILRCNIIEGMATTEALVEENLYAEPQVVVTLQGGSAEALAEYVNENGEALLDFFEIAERDRDIFFGENFSEKRLDALIKNKFGFDMRIPKGFTLRKDEKDFLWLSNEYPTASQGVLIYSYPADRGSKSLLMEPLVERRNGFSALVPGPSNGSYMTTFLDFMPDHRLIRIDGRVWAEMRGLWDVQGDFMGGPFVSYSTLYEDRVITLDFYVYSPKLGKRNFIHSLEHMIHNVKFPKEEEQAKDQK